MFYTIYDSIIKRSAIAIPQAIAEALPPKLEHLTLGAPLRKILGKSNMAVEHPKIEILMGTSTVNAGFSIATFEK